MPGLRTLVCAAHPDDETLWAYDFIVRNPGIHVAVCSIDRRPGKEMRVEHFYRACEAMKAVPFVLAGDFMMWDLDPRPIVEFAKAYELIVTHNEVGEYGHPAHTRVNEALRSLGRPMKVFGHGLVAGEPIDYEGKLKVLDIYQDPALVPWLTKQGMNLKCEALLDR